LRRDTVAALFFMMAVSVISMMSDRAGKPEESRALRISSMS
jgi:hypothetical protein